VPTADFAGQSARPFVFSGKEKLASLGKRGGILQLAIPGGDFDGNVEVVTRAWLSDGVAAPRHHFDSFVNQETKQ
jgi:hypothetical protein